MSKTKNKNSVAAVYFKNKKTGKWFITGYLSQRDEEQGKDIDLDRKGYKIVAL